MSSAEIERSFQFNNLKRWKNSLIDHMSDLMTTNLERMNGKWRYNSNCKIVVELQPGVAVGGRKISKNKSIDNDWVTNFFYSLVKTSMFYDI